MFDVKGIKVQMKSVSNFFVGTIRRGKNEKLHECVTFEIVRTN